MEIYLKLLAAAMLQVAITVVFFLLQKKTPFGKRSYWTQQIVIGLVFGLAAICGTEFGVPLDGATANARDAAPLCAGLIFGGPAGIIAGCIGGIERWFAVYWGAGMYSRVACSVSTIIAGVLPAFIRKTMSEGKRPSIGMGAAVALVMEVLHLTILFLTHQTDVKQAYEIVNICTVPMILANVVSVALAILVLDILDGEVKLWWSDRFTIARKFQNRMLVLVVLAYIVTTVFTFTLQTSSAKMDAEELMLLNIQDVGQDVVDIAERPQSEETLVLSLRGLTNNRRLGETGRILIIGPHNRVVSGGNGILTLEETGLEIPTDTPEMEVHEGTFQGEDVLWLYLTSLGYRVVAIMPMSEVYSDRDESFYVNSYMEILVFAALFVLIYFLLQKIVLEDLHSVNQDLEQITGGNLNVTVDVRDSKEFDFLSDRINDAVDTLKRYIREAEARMAKDLRMARNIQHAALSTDFPQNPAYRLYATMDAAKEVGGDFYDFYPLGEDRIGVLVADVSGKSIPGALFMMRAKTVLRGFVELELPVDEILTRANNELCEGNEAGMFVTAWLGIFDLNTGEVSFANAGHNPPLVYRKGKGWEYLRTKAGFVLAGMEDFPYGKQSFTLSPGDRLFLYTDGVTEATNLQEKLYGEDRLLEILESVADKPPEEVLQSVKEDIDAFAGDAEQFDDITMLLLDALGKEKDNYD